MPARKAPEGACCDKCGKPIKRLISQRNALKNGYCRACYKELPWVACSECGEQHKTLQRADFVCHSCKLAKRKCVRCGKAVPRAGMTLKHGVACDSCAKHFREPQPCPHCGNYSLTLSRNLKEGITEPVCQRCRREGHITCPRCGKYRRPEGQDSQGRVVCKGCLEQGDKPFVCPKCHKPGKPHSKTKCQACYWTGYVEKKLKDALLLIKHGWIRDSFKDFIHDLIGRRSPHFAAMRFERYFLFFAKLDVMFDSVSDVNASALLEEFTLEGLRRHSVPYGYLVRVGIVSALDEKTVARAKEQASHGMLLQRTEGRWFEKDVRAFYESMQTLSQRFASRGWHGDRARMVGRTLTSGLRAAILFYEHIDAAEIRSSSQIHQELVDSFIFENPGYANSLRRLVKYLNRDARLFRKVKIEKRPTGMKAGMFLSIVRYRELIRTWLSAAENHLKEGVICLFMLLYAQPAKRIVRLRLSDLERDDKGIYKVCFGATEIALDARVSMLLDNYVRQRKALAVMEDDWNNAFLFPGRKYASHLTEAAVTTYMKKYGVSADQLFASAIYFAYQSGLRQPKVITKAFGVTDATAIKYLKIIDPRLFDEAERIRYSQRAA